MTSPWRKTNPSTDDDTSRDHDNASIRLAKVRARPHEAQTDASAGPASANATDTALQGTDLPPPPISGNENGNGSVRSGPVSKRFSLLRFRHFSDTQLFTRAKLQATESDLQPGSPAGGAAVGDPTPAIVMTSPTFDDSTSRNSHKLGDKPLTGVRSSSKLSQTSEPDLLDSPRPSTSILPWRKSTDQRRPLVANNRLSLALNGQHHSSSDLTAPRSKSIADAQRPSSERGARRFFRSNKRKSLFPLPPQRPQTVTPPDSATVTPRVSMTALAADPQPDSNLSHADPHSPNAEDLGPTLQQDHRTRSAVSFATPSQFTLVRNTSSHSVPSSRSPTSAGHSTLRPVTRDRTSTMSTFPRVSDDMTPPPTLSGSTRNSTSTSNRTSLGGLLTFNRFRHGSDTNGSRHASPGPHSKSNSFAISRDLQHPPSREGNETAALYLERVHNLVPRSAIAATLSQSGDPFLQTVLRSYTRKLAFFGEPIDMSLRKFLLEAELPKETVHVDRVIQAFADRYHECNPGIFMSADEAYVIAFSLMMLHTDAYNKSNKHKMSKEDYIKNARGQHVAEDILACFYENICYTPFIHFDEDDYDSKSEKLIAMRNRKLKLKNPPDSARRPSGPVDPYSLIIESKLDQLRPSIKTSTGLEDPYTYLGTLKRLNSAKIQATVMSTGLLEIISARSRPAAFETQATRDNPDDSRPGVVQIRVTKVGTLWRKSAKKKKTRSPWQEWGAILTGSQLYFFRNLNWIKTLMSQHQSHQKSGHRTAVVFTPSLEEFKPDDSAKTEDAVALLDRSYNKHKNAFQLLRTGGEEEVFLADSETDLNEWISLINYTAAFRYAGVSVRGSLENKATQSDQPPLRIDRMNSTTTTATVSSVRSQSLVDLPRPVPVTSQAVLQIMAARRKVMIVRIAEAEIALADMNKRLEEILRNARHLQVLAPIQPRTRDVVIHAAARTDAMLKWSRREIWKTRCYKDILSMDALEDSDAVINESAKISTSSALRQSHEGSNRQSVEREMSAIEDSQNQRDNTTPVRRTPKMSFEPLQLASPGTPFGDADVFKTPPEEHRPLHALPKASRTSLTVGDVTNDAVGRAGSVNSLSDSASLARGPSVTHVSSRSSMQDGDGLAPSPSLPSGRPAPRTPLSNVKSAEAALSSQAPSAASSAGRNTNDSIGVTPESATGKVRHRMSLHRSFRDNPPEVTSQRHRRARDSASTIRSELGNGDKTEEGSTGLERGQGSFIVHGKQASVITFGGDWTDDKMRIRREGDRNSKTIDPEQLREQLKEDDSPKDVQGAVVTGDAVSDEPEIGAPESSDQAILSAFDTSLDVTHDLELAETYADGTHDASITARSRSDSEAPGEGLDREFYDAPDIQSASTSNVNGGDFNGTKS